MLDQYDILKVNDRFESNLKRNRTSVRFECKLIVNPQN